MQRIAERCRRAYISEREMLRSNGFGTTRYTPHPRWDGGIDDMGRERKPIWPKIAEFAIKHNLSPEAMISARFRAAVTSNHTVMPNDIAHARFLQLYQESEDSEDDVKTAWQMQYDYLCREAARQRRLVASPNKLNNRKVLQLILRDHASQLSALVRYVLAVRFGLKEEAKEWFHPAVDQYMLSPEAYNAVVGTVLPEAFTSEATSRINGRKL